MSGLGSQPIVRPIRPHEVAAAARVLFRSANHAYKDINWHHPEGDVVDWFIRTSAGERWTHIEVAIVGDEVCGVMCLEPSHVDQLFVDLGWQGKGIGKALLEAAKRAYPEGFDLYVFQKNTPAVAFYGAMGLRRGEEGVSEQEGEKDFKYHWEPESKS